MVVTKMTMTNMGTEIYAMAEDVRGADPDKWLPATKWFRELSSTEFVDEGNVNEYLDKIVAFRVILKFVRFMRKGKRAELQREALGALVNISSGRKKHMKSVLSAGVLPGLIKLLKSDSEDLQEQSAAILNNIAKHGPIFRDVVLKFEAIPPLSTLLPKSKQLSTIQTGAKLLANLYRGTEPLPDFEKISPSLKVLTTLLYIPDSDVLANACSALACFCEGFKHNIHVVVDMGVCIRLIDLLIHTNEHVATAALQVVKAIMLNDESKKQVMIDCSVLPKLMHLLSSDYKEICEGVCAIIADVTAECQDYIQAVIDVGIVPDLIDAVCLGDFDVRKKAAEALMNVSCTGSDTQVRYVVEQDYIPPLREIFTNLDSKLILQGLKSVERILSVGEDSAKETGGINPYIATIKELLDKINNLKSHENEEICKRATRIYNDCRGEIVGDC